MSTLKEKIKIIIFGTDTKAGKLFDVVLIISIVLSIITVMLDSIVEYNQQYGHILRIAEWTFTIMFTVEYLLRIYSIRRPLSYIFSFFGIIDFLAILPTYLSLFMPGTEVFAIIRVLRVLRIFRVLKLVQFTGEADMLMTAMIASRRKVFIWLFLVMNIVIILGSVMYLVEGGNTGFDSIPRSIYWAVVTLTTVGYGNVVPLTSLGQALASFIMVLGYSIIAVPTGIVTSEITFAAKSIKEQRCVVCGKEGLHEDAKFCSNCASKLTG
ncbi:MAG: ion transporter [Candidatus Neomarinimicrobiota bacterium]